MIEFRTDDTVIYVERVERLGRTERRRAEREAVVRIIANVFGASAVLSHREDGSPYVEDFDGFISISHGADFAVVAVNSLQPIGVDIERWRESLRKVAPRVLDQREMELYSTDRPSLLRAWPAQEAIFKAAGVADLVLSEIRLPGMVGDRRFQVVFFERGQRTLALANEDFC